MVFAKLFLNALKKRVSLMKSFKFGIGIFILAVLLSACGPMYKTDYQYIPPRSQMGQMCVSQCMQTQSMCGQMCELKNQNCRIQARQDSILEYEMYNRHDANRFGHRTLNSFDRSWMCNQSCDCEANYRACYTACGGQVLSNTVCVANCEKR